MDRKALKKKKRTKQINKLRNMVQNNATDQDRLDINPNSYKNLGNDGDGNPIILKKFKSKNDEYYEAIISSDAYNRAIEIASAKEN